MPYQISEITRRDLRELFAEVPWWGRLEESEFLSRLYDLDALPSHDPRHTTAAEDIIRHRVANDDWPNDWVFEDDRFALERADDELLLRFLAETLHPVVRSSQAEAEALADRINVMLQPDGYRLVPARRVSGRPVYNWVRDDPPALPASAEHHFTEDTRPLLNALAHLAEVNGTELEQQVLRQARPVIDEPEHDNWNGGTYYYTLQLTVPLDLFAQLGDKVNELEQQIAKRIEHVLRTPDHRKLSAVVIQPSFSRDTAALSDVITSRAAARHPAFWAPGYFRLFLSHVSSFKVRTEALRQALRPYHVSAFVAHETIEPGELWQREIEAALRTMDAMAVVLTPDFHASKWTDQEIGWALGREVYVLPIRRQADPYGFIGEVQGVQGVGKTVKQVAEEVFKTLTRHRKTRVRLTEALALGVEEAIDERRVEFLLKLIAGIPSVPEDCVSRVETALTTKRLVQSQAIRQLMRKIAAKIPTF